MDFKEDQLTIEARHIDRKSNEENLMTKDQKLHEFEESVRVEYGADVVIVQNGYFYEAYGDSAQIICGLLDYKIFERMGFEGVCGFPPDQMHACIEAVEKTARKVAVVEQVGKGSKRMLREVRYLTGDLNLALSNLELKYLEK